MRETYGTAMSMRDMDEEWEIEESQESYLKRRVNAQAEAERLRAEGAPESPFAEDDGA